MRKFKLFLLISALCLVSATTASAYDFEVDGIYYNLTSGGHPIENNIVSVVDAPDGYSGDVTIPSTVNYNGKVLFVTGISDKAFYNCTELTSIVIPEGITDIRDQAFYGCSNLTSVIIPSSVTYIYKQAFAYCSNLTDVTSNAINAPTLYSGVFEGINSGAILHYPIGSNYLSWSEQIKVEGAVSEKYRTSTWVVDDYGHAIVSSPYEIDPYGGNKVIKELHVENGRISNFYLSTIPTLEKVYMQAPQEINYGLFTDCTNLREIHFTGWQPTATSIGEGAFGGCPNLEYFKIPHDVTSIGRGAFAGCSKLKYINLPESLVSIADDAFTGTSIEVFIVPASIENIGEQFTLTDPVWIYKGMVNESNVPSHFKYYYPAEGAGYGFPGQPYYDDYVIVGNKIYVWDEISRPDLFIDDIEYSNATNKEMIDTIILINYLYNYSFDCLKMLPSTISVYIPEVFIEEMWGVFTQEGINALYYDVAGVRELIWCAGNDVVIPEDVTLIGGGFIGGGSLWNLNSIEIPYGIKGIENYAIEDSPHLTSVELPSSLHFIGPLAFSNCDNLTRIVVDEGNVTYDSRDNCNAVIETATNKLILGCKGTVIPPSVTSIGNSAFAGRFNEDITIPATVTSIEANAFNNIYGDRPNNNNLNLYFESEVPPVIDGDIFGGSVAYVPAAAYDTYCNADVWRDYTDRIIPREMSEYTINVSSTESMSGVLKAIGVNNVEKVTKLKVKGKINSYDIMIFRDKMPLLTDLDLSEATVIASKKPFYQTYCTENNFLGDYAFYDLDRLAHVKLPQTLERIGKYTFAECGHLRSVDASSIEPLEIGYGAFYNCQELTEVTMPKCASVIGKNAFYKCSKLNELKLDKIIGSIEGGVECGAFYLSGIETFYIDSIGGDIESEAFSQCDNLTEVKIGTIAGELKTMAFNRCRNLKTVEIGQGPTKIGANLFKGSNAIESFVAGEGLIEVAKNAFVSTCYYIYDYRQVEQTVENKSLKRVVLPNSVKSIGEMAFYLCCSLTDFSMPQSLTSLGERAFEECSSLNSINIPKGLTDIPRGAFWHCEALKSVTFYDGVKSIGESAFSECSIESLELPLTLRSIGESAFYYNPELTELHIPSSIETIGNGAFGWCDKLNSVYTYTVEPTTITETTFSTFKTATLYVPSTSFWNYYWDIGWSKFNQKYFKEFNEPYKYFYINGDYQLDSSTGYIAGTPDADLRPGSGLIVIGEESSEARGMRSECARQATPRSDGGEATMMRLSNVNMESDGSGNSASVIGDSKLYVDTLNMRIEVKGGRWYFLAFPYDVPFSRITMQDGSDYIFRYYDSAQRAKSGNGSWKVVNDDYLKAVQGYIFQSANDDVLIVSVEGVQFDGSDKLNKLVTYPSNSLKDASWNLMGNPYLSYYDLAAMDYTAPVTVWDGSKYVAVRPGDDDYCLAPYEAFFVQKPEGKESIAFNFDNQMTKTQSLQALSLQAEARRTAVASPNRQIVNLVFGDDENTDHTRVVFNSRASHDYETACDAAKFETTGMPQLYTIGGESVRYAINERPEGDGVVAIGYSVPCSGYYSINATRSDAEVFLYDAETKDKHYFEDGAYCFYSEKGEYNARFSLGIRSKETTEIETVDADDVVIAIAGGIEFKTYANAKVYNTAGMLVAMQHGTGVVELPAGTYIVNIGNRNTKVVVK